MALTKRSIDSLAPRVGGSDYFAWDEGLRGFGVRVWPSGVKTFVAQYRSSGRTRRYKIGDYGSLTVDEARKQARAVLGDVARGEDPADERATRRKSLTVADLCDIYLAAARNGLVRGKDGKAKKSSTLDIDAGRVARHIKPLLGRKLVIAITTADLNRFVRDVTAGKTAVTLKTVKGRAAVTGGAGTASRTMGLLGGILSYAVAEGVIAISPARGVRRPADGRRTRRLTIEEYGALGRALTAAEQGGEAWQGIAGIRLLALTGARRGEVINLKWSEVDLDGHALRLEDSKTGSSTRPLGAPAAILLRDLPTANHLGSGTNVFPPMRKAKFYRGLSGMLERITAGASLQGVTAHVLRHSFASMAGDLDFADSTIGALLGHSTSTITGRYVHRLDRTLVAAADKVAESIADAMAAGGG